MTNLIPNILFVSLPSFCLPFAHVSCIFTHLLALPDFKTKASPVDTALPPTHQLQGEKFKVVKITNFSTKVATRATCSWLEQSWLLSIKSPCHQHVCLLNHHFCYASRPFQWWNHLVTSSPSSPISHLPQSSPALGPAASFFLGSGKIFLRLLPWDPSGGSSLGNFKGNLPKCGFYPPKWWFNWSVDLAW